MPIKRVDSTKYQTDVDDGVFEPEDENVIAPTSQSIQRNLDWNDVMDMPDRLNDTGGDGIWFKATTRPSLISFPRPGPVEVFYQHWIEMTKKSLRCLEDNCPLCAIGQQAGKRVALEIVEFAQDENGEFSERQKFWNCPPGTSKTLAEINLDPFKGGPIFQNFFSVYAQEKKPFMIMPVKKRDLEDPPWNLDAQSLVEAVQYATDNPLEYKPVDLAAVYKTASEIASKIKTKA